MSALPATIAQRELPSWEQLVILTAIREHNLPVIEAFADRMRHPWATQPQAVFAADAALNTEAREPCLILAARGILPSAGELATRCQRAPGLVRDMLEAAGPIWTFRRLMEAAQLDAATNSTAALDALTGVGAPLADPRYPRPLLVAAVTLGDARVVQRLIEAGTPGAGDAIAQASRFGRDHLVEILEAAPRARPTVTA